MTEFADEHRTRWRLWMIAAAIALALHLGGAALAVAHLRSSDDGDSLGAAVADIGVELASPPKEETDLPVGPDNDAAIASPALAEQKAEVKPTDLPKDTPTESEDPDRVVTQNESKKPVEDDPKIETVQTAASPESVAQEATAKQTLEAALEAPAAASPNIGIGKDKERLAAKWGSQISAYFKLHQRYPKIQKLKSALVKVNIVLNRLGNILEVSIAESSGDSAFDEAAIDMIRRSDPVPRPPAGLTDERFSRSLAIKFNERK